MIATDSTVNTASCLSRLYVYICVPLYKNRILVCRYNNLNGLK